MRQVPLCFAFLILSFTPLFANQWGTEYLKFELPETWKCQTDENQYICYPADASKRKEALIVTAAKIEDSKEDTLEKYYDYLKKPKEIKTPNGQTITNKVHLIKYISINDTKWIDALHESSEVPDYYTRYLATIQSGIVIVLAYSTSVEKNILYIKDLRSMVQTLKVTAKIPTLKE